MNRTRKHRVSAPSRMRNWLPWLAGFALALTATSVVAHHGWSNYDAGQAVTLEAKLESVQYANPHAEVEVEHAGQRWTAILAPVSRMEARGLPPDALQVGKTVTLEGYPKRDGSPEMRIERIVVDGKTVELR